MGPVQLGFLQIKSHLTNIDKRTLQSEDDYFMSQKSLLLFPSLQLLLVASKLPFSSWKHALIPDLSDGLLQVRYQKAFLTQSISLPRTARTTSSILELIAVCLCHSSILSNGYTKQHFPAFPSSGYTVTRSQPNPKQVIHRSLLIRTPCAQIKATMAAQPYEHVGIRRNLTPCENPASWLPIDRFQVGPFGLAAEGGFQIQMSWAGRPR